VKRTNRRKLSCRSLICIFVLWLLPLNRINAAAASLVDNSDLLHWSSEARLDRFPKAVPGSLAISGQGVDFHPARGEAAHWNLEDIRTVDLQSPRKLSLVTYHNRRWHIPGDRPLNFKLKDALPPEVASELVRLVGKPAVNGVPFPKAPSFATIGARHRTSTGGSNGVLRFREGGIDYLAAKGDDSRSWRWPDIQTLAHPEPCRLRIGGFLEAFDFELKGVLADDLFDRLWDRVYANGLNTGERGAAHAGSH
jgi:hypothetical protein